MVEEVRIPVADGETVAGLWQSATPTLACLVLAHGAGAGMQHTGMAKLADGLASRGVATLRYQFPFIERGSRRVDPPAVAHRTVRAAVAAAPRWAGDSPLVAGGRSFGARMTSQAQALAPLPGVRGLVFFAFPLHPAGKPATSRADHLVDVAVPMLFLQGTRDALADMTLLRPVLDGLGPVATLKAAEGADHSFGMLRKEERSSAAVVSDLLDEAARWIGRIVG